MNSALTIRNTMESLKSQRFKNFEHIICDGGSNDHTAEILENYDKAYNLKWISESDNGIAEALNKGLALAQGRYIIVIQADDRILNPQILENAYSLLNSEEADLWSFPIIYNDRNQGMVLKKPIRFLWWHHFKTIFPHQGCFVHRRIYNRIGNYNNEFKIAMDYDFFYRALQIGPRVHFSNEPLAVMGGRGISSSRAFLQARLIEEYRIQMFNELNPFWRISQKGFRFFYRLYKLRIQIRSSKLPQPKFPAPQNRKEN